MERKILYNRIKSIIRNKKARDIHFMFYQMDKNRCMMQRFLKLKT